MNRQEANKQILDMYNDSTYQELKAYYEKTTIFNVLGVERSETRHSAFLCWLLNANASHGLGEEPMKKLLRLYATKMDDDSSFRIMLMTGDYELEMNDIVRGTGDFYTNEKDLLVVRGERIMCVKWWKKTDGSFQQLIEHVRQNFPYIQIEEY